MKYGYHIYCFIILIFTSTFTDTLGLKKGSKKEKILSHSFEQSLHDLQIIYSLEELPLDFTYGERIQIPQGLSENGEEKIMYDCFLPQSEDLENDDENPKEKELQKLSSTQSLGMAVELLQPIDGLCVVRLSGWWSYELCFGEGISQYHQEESKITAKFSLGNSPRTDGIHFPNQNENIENENTFNPNNKGKDDKKAAFSGQPYLVETYEHGDICDLTGKPRTSEVHYFCSPTTISPSPSSSSPSSTSSKASTFISNFIEPSTCNYIFEIGTSLLCSHPSFKITKSKTEKTFCIKNIPFHEKEKHFQIENEKKRQKDEIEKENPMLKEARQSYSETIQKKINEKQSQHNERVKQLTDNFLSLSSSSPKKKFHNNLKSQTKKQSQKENFHENEKENLYENENENENEKIVFELEREITLNENENEENSFNQQYEDEVVEDEVVEDEDEVETEKEEIVEEEENIGNKRFNPKQRETTPKSR